MSDERRVHSRYTVWFPVTLDADTEKVWAVCRDVGPGGILLAANTPLSLGATVNATFRLTPDDPEERRVQGHVVRIEPISEENPRGLWPYRMAVEFDSPVPEIEAPLKRASEHPPEPPPPSARPK